MCAMVGRTFALTGDIDVSGGSCGGDMEAAAVSLGTTAEVNADSAQDAGTVTLNAQQITTFGSCTPPAPRPAHWPASCSSRAAP